MKGIHKRYLDRTASRTVDRSMAIYEQTLDQIVRAAGDGKNYRQDQQELNKTIPVGEPVVVRCEDNPAYFRTILIRKNDFSSSYQALISNVTPGSSPPEMREVSQEQVFRRIRELNATTTSTDLRAFPVPVEGPSYGTQPGPLVSDLHRSLQKRGGQ